MPQIRVRTAYIEDANRIAQINTDSWRRTYRGIVPDAYLDAIDLAARERNIRERLLAEAGSAATRMFVIEDERAEIVGYVSAGDARPMVDGALPAGYAGEVYALYIAPDLERHGLGSRLVYAAATYLRDVGMPSLIIWALAANPNRGFYVALGGVAAYEQTITIGEAALREIGFGWPDINALIARVAPQAQSRRLPFAARGAYR